MKEKTKVISDFGIIGEIDSQTHEFSVVPPYWSEAFTYYGAFLEIQPKSGMIEPKLIYWGKTG